MRGAAVAAPLLSHKQETTVASIFRRKPGGAWQIEYTDEQDRRRRVSSGTNDRRLAQQIAAKLEREAVERKAGLTAPTASREPIGELIAAYVADLRRQGRSPKYVLSRERILARLAKLAGWAKAADLKPTSLTRALASIAGAGRTLNWYRDGAVWFATWLVRTGRLGTNPLVQIRRGREMRTYRRRALTKDELNKLLDTAPPHRAFCYALMAYSGLRAGEARQVTRGDVDVTSGSWRWKLRAEATKAGRDEALPMLPECQELLIEWYTGFADMALEAKLVPTLPDRQTLLVDLGKAGIETPGADGRVVDYHSLRYTFCTRLAQVLPIQTVRVLMRHRDINLTVKVYLDLGLTDIAEEIKKLPRLFTEE